MAYLSQNIADSNKSAIWKYRIIYSHLSNWEPQCNPVIVRKKEILHIQVFGTFRLLSANCETGIDFEVLICSLPGKHFSLQLYAESSIDAIIYWAETARPDLRIPDDGLVPTTHLGNEHRWPESADRFGLSDRSVHCPLSSSRLSKRVLCRRGLSAVNFIGLYRAIWRAFRILGYSLRINTQNASVFFW